ncbi:MAG TPA: low affinity iron permease family protein [Pyrinomonadaceae bacterium]|jgi:low affinity Fe/Cu permease|nr:low affinity iron permease family protein [Pyrinomonadaceae bacterium]
MAKSPSFFTRFANATAHATGKPVTFILAVSVVVVWAVTGPLFGFSDTWQLVINTGTTIITFLMVFLIQNTQNRDGLAVQLKLDELIKAIEAANNEVLDAEDFDEKDLAERRDEMMALAEKAKKAADKLERKKTTRAKTPKRQT